MPIFIEGLGVLVVMIASLGLVVQGISFLRSGVKSLKAPHKETPPEDIYFHRG